jgi:hypothetical protein
VNTSLLQKLKDICHILNEHSVEYLIIGGAAVALHGHYRMSRDSTGQDTEVDDLDFWYNPTYDNYFRLLNALEEIGQDVSGFREEKAPDPERSFFRLERPQFTLDFLPKMPGLQRFREAFSAGDNPTWRCRDAFYRLQSPDHQKQALGRAKDMDDIRHLQLKHDQRPPQTRQGKRPR